MAGECLIHYTLPLRLLPELDGGPSGQQRQPQEEFKEGQVQDGLIGLRLVATDSGNGNKPGPDTQAR